jgi:hypothetical protein
MAESSVQTSESVLSVTANNELLDTTAAQEAELFPQPILPRQAWNSQLAYLKAILKAKQALDKREKAFTRK